MTTIDDGGITRGSIPDPYCLVFTCRHDTAPIRRPHCRPNTINMSRVDKESSSAIRVPYADCVVSARRGDTLVIGGRPFYCMHRHQMLRVCKEQRSSSSIMHLNQLIFTPKGNAFAIMRPHNSILR